MMKTISPATLYMMLGTPGAGKTFFARQFSEVQQAALIDIQRLRYELFEEPVYTDDEDRVVKSLADYMADQFLNAGISVVFDGMNSTRVRRQTLREKARRYQAKPLIVWVQTDANTAFGRAHTRDRRNPNDKFAKEIDSDEFDSEVKRMKLPQHEDYVVISGKHVFKNQHNAILRKLQQLHKQTSSAEPNALATQPLRPPMPRSRPRTPRQI